MKQNIDRTKSSWLIWNKNAKERKLTNTLKLTYNLFLKRNSIKQIAKQRKFKEESIERQIIDLITMGFIHVDDVLGEEKRKQIEIKITNKNIDSLKEIKDSLRINYTYFEIKCILAHINLEPEKIK